MKLFRKKELKLNKFIFLFLILFNPLLINSFANTKYIIDQNIKNTKLTKSDNNLIADSDLINRARNINPYINNLPENESSDKIKFKENLILNEELDKIKKKYNSVNEDNVNKPYINSTNSKNPPNERKKIIIEINDDTVKNNNLKTKYLSTPQVGDISVGEFEIPTRGYVKLKEGEITLNLVKADAIQTLRLI